MNEVIVKMLTGRFDGVNLSLFALFNIMGVWPMVFVVVLAFDTTEQKVWRWPFVCGSFALGAFALLPYFVLRKWGAPKRQANGWWLRVLGSRWVALALCGAAGALVTLFFASGQLAGFTALFRGDQFTYIMSFDFVACSIAGGLLAFEDSEVRPTSPSWAWSLGSVIGVSWRYFRAPLATVR